MGWGWNHQPDSLVFWGETHGLPAENPATHPAIRWEEDFMAFAVAYLPSELSSVLGVLLLGVVGPVLGESFGWKRQQVGCF